MRAVEVSVVIPCFNGADLIARQLSALARQSNTASFEIVVADNRSTDDIDTVVRAHAISASDIPVRVVPAHDRQGINHARNAGARAARGDVVLFCDVDDEVGHDWVESYVQAFRAGTHLAGGVSTPVNAAGARVGRDLGLLNSLDYLGWPLGANCAVSASVLEDVGPFDESYVGGGDETEFFWRAQLAGYRLDLVPGAHVRYVQRSGWIGSFRQGRAFGRSQVKLYTEFAERGMERRSLTVSARIAVRSAVRSAAFSPAVRIAGARQLGVSWGRARESWRRRCLFL